MQTLNQLEGIAVNDSNLHAGGLRLKWRNQRPMPRVAIPAAI